MAELNTGVDKLLELVKSKKKISIAQASSILKQKPDLVREWADFLEDENKIYIDSGFSVDILLDADYAAQQMPKKFKLIAKPVEQAKPVLIKSDLKKNPDIKIIDEYSYKFKDINIDVVVMKKKGEFVLLYGLFVSSISATTEFVLEKIRQELVDKISLGFSDITDKKKSRFIEDKFEQAIKIMIDKYFIDADAQTKDFLFSYLVSKSLGLGNIDLLMSDVNLEEIVINQAQEPVWIYHRKHGWLKTNVTLKDEEQIRHYASMIGRKIGRQINVLEPLLDAHLNEGDRVNATLSPISTRGNTITIRKFAKDPWTITKMLKSSTISYDAAAIMWMAIQYELSAIIAGGTASGKTSTLNCLANFFPPNQRIISIEDTRELQLPKFLHWVPLNTRLPNSEGKGAISMEDLLINSLRMRPDRILVGEVRRQKEVETLFEAIHTGHSCYATFHANTAQETVERLTNPPINVPKLMLPAISIILIQFRNRRTDVRRTFQLAEILPDSKAKVLMQYDPKKDILKKSGVSSSLFNTLSLYTGFSRQEVSRVLSKKVEILKYMVKNDILDIDMVGRIMAEYYTDQDNLLKYVRSGKKF
ncbi:CpaF family protein [Candidatus Woesearchaeota archaeon]|nr:CpaF family protein [Candidatus Woesearchaeota archaeon]HIJ02563.1 CpaF family protein [Candidatus Woesearchaeota archaeon]